MKPNTKKRVYLVVNMQIMKRTIIAALAAFGILTGASTQAVAQVEAGSFMIDPYVGVPTGNMWWQALANETDFETVGAPISFGGRIEYMVADNFGMGIDANYVVTGYEYTCVGCGSYDTVSMSYANYTTGFKAKKLRIMLRLNYHFVQTENLDVYLGVGAGYKNVNREFTIDGENDGSATIPTLIPVAVRFALGGRFYFHPNIGLNFELGAGGGGIIQAGVAVKI